MQSVGNLAGDLERPRPLHTTVELHQIVAHG
jgi:hypothetical protein